jgi:hypothetical protein
LRFSSRRNERSGLISLSVLLGWNKFIDYVGFDYELDRIMGAIPSSSSTATDVYSLTLGAEAHVGTEANYYLNTTPVHCEYVRHNTNSVCAILQGDVLQYGNQGFQQLEEEIQTLLPKMRHIARSRSVAVAFSSFGFETISGGHVKGVWAFIEVFDPTRRSSKAHELKKMQHDLMKLFACSIQEHHPNIKEHDARPLFDQLRGVVSKFSLTGEDLQQFFVQREFMVTTYCTACKEAIFVSLDTM